MALLNEADLQNAYYEIQAETNKEFERSLCWLIKTGDSIASSYPNSGPISRFKQRRALQKASRAFEESSSIRDAVDQIFPESSGYFHEYSIGTFQTLQVGVFGSILLNGRIVSGDSKRELTNKYMPAIKLIEGRAEELSQKKVAEDITKLTI